jgi:hypothetical protein
MPKGPGPIQRWLLTYLRETAVAEGRSEWVAVNDLAEIRNGADGAPSRNDIEGVRRSVKSLAAQGLVQVEARPRSVVRTVISPLGNSRSSQIVEERDVVVVRLVPSLQQQLEEALISLAEAEARVLAHPGWRFAEQGRERAKREADRLAAEVEVEQTST